MSARRSDVPPRATAPVTPYADSFVGRQADLATLDATFANGARLVTVWGPAGVGKTRLATEFVSRSAGDPPGVVHVELGAAHDAASVCRVAARSLDVQLPDVDAIRAIDRLGRAIDVRGIAWIVIDDVEAVIAVVADAVARWLTLAPRVRIVVTSRELLRVAGERAHQLEPLGLVAHDDVPWSDAAALMIARIGQVDRHYAPDAAEVRLLEDIVAQLDGMPLAIELAAARAIALGARAIHAGLAQRFALLSHGRRHAPPHQRTLREAIAWSWDLLEPDARNVLAQLGVFEGSFGLDAARVVVALDGSDFDAVLQSLCERSLVRVIRSPRDPGRTRYAMYLSIRAFAREQLDAIGSRAVTEARHAAFYGELAASCADALRGSSGVAVRAQFELERDDVVAAVERALAQRPLVPAARMFALRVLTALEGFVLHPGPLDPYLASMEAALDGIDPGTVDRALVARASCARGEALRLRGRLDESLAELQKAASLAREAGREDIEGRALCREAGVQGARGDLEAARALCERALALHVASGDRFFEVVTRGNLGTLLARAGRADEAHASFDAASRLAGEIGAIGQEGFVRTQHALVQIDSGRLDEARRDLERALVIHDELGLVRYQCVARTYLGALHQIESRFDAAEDCYREALRAARETGYQRFVGMARGLWAWLDLQRGTVERARSGFDAAATQLDEMGDPRYAAFFRGGVAILDAREHGAVAGEATFARALVATTDADDPVARALVMARDAACRGVRIDAVTSHRSMQSLEWRIVRGLFAADETSAVAEPRTLAVHHKGHWFELAPGPRVDCRQRQAIRRMLLRLARHRLDAPDRPLTMDALVEAGWPGVRMHPDSARNRLHVSLTRLRHLGLQDVLRGDDDGYLLDPRVGVRIVDDDDEAAPPHDPRR